MTKLIGTLVVSGTLLVLPAVARAQAEEQEDSSWFVATDEAGTEPQAAAPSPYAPPPAPPYESPSPPQAESQAPSSLPDGQWVYTQQYGWIWMAYADGYTHVPANGYGEPYAYVYYPTFGWTWLAAPWVWGFGPWPSFGVYGPARFGWYGHGWWRSPSRWHYAPARAGVYGTRPAPAYRSGTGYGGVRPAPAYRNSPGYGGRSAPVYRGGSGGGAVRPAPGRLNQGSRGGGSVPGPYHGGRTGGGHGGSGVHVRGGHG